MEAGSTSHGSSQLPIACKAQGLDRMAPGRDLLCASWDLVPGSEPGRTQRQQGPEMEKQPGLLHPAWKNVAAALEAALALFGALSKGGRAYVR